MGDGADMALEQAEQADEMRLDYRMGLLDYAEAYENGIIDELGYEIGNGRVTTKTCRCCKTAGLHWDTHKGKWRLFDDKGLHFCPAVPLKD
jgi:hypothetical protein